MRKIPVEEAVGQTLCHDMTAILANGFKGVKFKRGHVVTEEDIPELLNIGKSHIFVWEPGAGEVHEEDAARAVTEAACGPNIAFTGPSEGKFQLLADADGLFCVNSGALRRINSVPDFTIACRPGNTAVRKGEKLGGARIVPLMTRRENVERAVEAAGEGTPVFQIKPFLSLKTSIVITGSEVYYGRIEDRFEPILREKLGAYGARILSVQKCPDDLDRLSEALDRCVEEGAELVLLTGGMSVDPDDPDPHGYPYVRGGAGHPGRAHAAWQYADHGLSGGHHAHRCARGVHAQQNYQPGYLSAPYFCGGEDYKRGDSRAGRRGILHGMQGVPVSPLLLRQELREGRKGE